MLATLQIIQGNNMINLLSLPSGFSLGEITFNIPAVKEGGVYQSSPLSRGRRLVQRELEDATDSYEILIEGFTQNQVINRLGNLFTGLEGSIVYFLTEGREGGLGYIKRQFLHATSPEYALIKSYTIPQIPDIFKQPFTNRPAILDKIDLQIEHGDWLANPPGEGECAEISNLRFWEYQAEWLSVRSSASEFLRMVQLAATGTILVGCDSAVHKSADLGATWATATIVGFGNVTAILELSSGNILIGSDTGRTRISADDGGTYGSPTATMVSVTEFCQLPDGTILAGQTGTTNFYRSTNGGGSWSSVSGPNAFRSLVCTSAGIVYGAGSHGIWRSDNGGTSWSKIYSWTTLFGEASLMVKADGTVVGLQTSQKNATYIVSMLSISGSTVTLLSNVVTSGSNPEIDKGSINGDTIFVSINFGADNRLYKSLDGGISWVLERSNTSATEDYNHSLLDSNGNYWVIQNDEVYKNNKITIDMGLDGDCDGTIYIVNKQVKANLTNIKVFDASGPTYTEIFPLTNLPKAFFPATLGSGDIAYFGIDDTIIDSGPFGSLVFDIDTAALDTLGGAWEYYNGSWTSLTVTDNTASFESFDRVGVLSIHFIPPSDWTTTTVDGVSGYWIRRRIVPGSAVASPTQDNRQIYAISNGYIEIAGGVTGDIPALLRLKLTNQSGAPGGRGSNPALWANRLIIGLRSFDTEPNLFQAFLNISDEQNPQGVTVTLGTNTSFAADPQAPTGRRATYNPAGVEAMATRATISFGASIARTFYGSFHFYLRAQRTAGNAEDLTVRIQVVTGSGGITHTSESRQLATTTAFELLDFDQIDIPVSGGISPEELPDTMEIRIQASAASGTPNLNLYDLIMIPVDEWAIDAVDNITNSTGSVMGEVTPGIKRLLDIDSISYPLLDIRSLVRQQSVNEPIIANYNPITGSEAIVPVGLEVLSRYWVLAAQTSVTGSAYSWIAPPEIAHSVQVYKNERFLIPRGDR